MSKDLGTGMKKAFEKPPCQIIPIRPGIPVKALMSGIDYVVYLLERKREWETIAEQIMVEAERILKASKVLGWSATRRAMHRALESNAVKVRDALVECDSSLAVFDDGYRIDEGSERMV